MKKNFLAIFEAIVSVQSMSAQLAFGLQAGANYSMLHWDNEKVASDDSGFGYTAGCLIEHNAIDIDNTPLIQFFNKIILEHPNAMIFAVYDDGINKQVLTNEQVSTFTLHDNSYTVVNF